MLLLVITDPLEAWVVDILCTHEWKRTSEEEEECGWRGGVETTFVMDVYDRV